MFTALHFNAAHNDSVKTGASKVNDAKLFQGQTPDKAATMKYTPSAMLY